MIRTAGLKKSTYPLFSVISTVDFRFVWLNPFKVNDKKALKPEFIHLKQNNKLLIDFTTFKKRSQIVSFKRRRMFENSVKCLYHEHFHHVICNSTSLQIPVSIYRCLVNGRHFYVKEARGLNPNFAWYNLWTLPY